LSQSVTAHGALNPTLQPNTVTQSLTANPFAGPANTNRKQLSEAKALGQAKRGSNSTHAKQTASPHSTRLQIQHLPKAAKRAFKRKPGLPLVQTQTSNRSRPPH
jgi:hypothetical protein